MIAGKSIDAAPITPDDRAEQVRPPIELIDRCVAPAYRRRSVFPAQSRFALARMSKMWRGDGFGGRDSGLLEDCRLYPSDRFMEAASISRIASCSLPIRSLQASHDVGLVLSASKCRRHANCCAHGGGMRAFPESGLGECRNNHRNCRQYQRSQLSIQRLLPARISQRYLKSSIERRFPLRPEMK